MSISSDLMMAILAMDSYNRGYGEGLIHGKNTIGEAVFELQSETAGDSDEVAAGFYAASYTWNGETIISYRGSNADNIGNWFTDAINGYGTILGSATTSQAELAAEFFQAVTQTENGDPATASVTLTGHSLGGGLAGLIAAIYRQDAVLFDNIPFEQAALNAYQMASSWTQSAPGAGVLEQSVWQTFFNSLSPWTPEISDNLHGYAVTGELVSSLGLRALQDTSVTSVDSNSDLLGLIDLHSQALLTSLMYANEPSNLHTDWIPIGTHLWTAAFDDDIGRAVGFQEEGADGAYDPSDKMLNAIAYSALDGSTGLVFGNSGIRAMFNDADELGRIVTQGTASGVLLDAISGLTEAIVQFAGTMAINEVDYLQTGNEHAIDGILSLYDNDTLLRIDVSKELWNLGGSDPEKVHEVEGFQAILTSVFDQAPDDSGSEDPSEIAAAIALLYGTEANIAAAAKAIDRIDFTVGSGSTTVQLEERDENVPYSASTASLYSGLDGADSIDGNSDNNIIVGGDGDDVIDGHDGKDILIGSDGDDVLVGGMGNDVLVGGDHALFLLDNPLLAGDTARYDAVRDDPTAEQPTPPEPTTGVVVDALSTKQLGDSDAVEVLVHDKRTNTSFGTDTLVEIETIELTDASDQVAVMDPMLGVDITIDMGASRRTQSELQPGEMLDPNAFTQNVDHADYSNLSNGIIYAGGNTRSNSGNLNFIEAVQTALGIGTHNLVVKGADKITLTDQDDVFVTSARGSIIETGAGSDTVWIAPDVAIADLSTDDQVMLFGLLPVFGGTRNRVSESPYATGFWGVQYGKNDVGELIIRVPWWQVAVTNADGSITTKAAEMYILNYAAEAGPRPDGIGEIGPGNIFLAEFEIIGNRLIDDFPTGFEWETSWELFGLFIKEGTGQDGYGGGDPIVLDLDGDGIELTALTSASASFDMDWDLYAEQSAFAGADDGLLARDINGDGVINTAYELIGRGTITGFSVLNALDGNGDGVINAADNGLADFDGDGSVTANDTFDDLLVWQDVNGNAVSEASELQTVTQRGITSFNVSAGPLATEEIVAGNRVIEKTDFTWSDGSTGTAGEVIFRVDNLDTSYIGDPITITAAAAALPDLKATGTVVSLREAMSYRSDSATDVSAALAGFTSGDLNALKDAVKPILSAWAMGSPVRLEDGTIVSGAAGLSTYRDVDVVEFGSSVTDYNWNYSQETVQRGDGSDGTKTSWSFASGVEISITTALGGTNYRLSDILNTWLAQTGLVDNGGGGPASFTDGNGEVLEISGGAPAGWQQNVIDVAAGTGTLSVELGTLTGTDIAIFERLIGESLDAVFAAPIDGAKANTMMLELLERIDTGLKLAAVRIAVQDGPLATSYFGSIDYDAESNKFTANTPRQLGDVYEALFTAAALEADPLAWIGAWEPFLDIVMGDFDRGASTLLPTYGFIVQNIADGLQESGLAQSLTAVAEALGVPAGLIIEGTGTVNGTNDHDIFYLDGTDQTLLGGAGMDNYIVGKQIGHDVINDSEVPVADGMSEDRIRFSHHTADQITATRTGADLILTITATGETIAVVDQFGGIWPGPTIADTSNDTGVHEIIFADGTVWTKFDIAAAVSTVDAASTTLIGTADTDVLEGGAGDDHLEGRGGFDLYKFSRGDGNDTIEENEDNEFRDAYDVISFGPDINYSDLVFSRTDDSIDLLISVSGTTDSITIQGQFGALYTGVYGAWYSDQIEALIFTDGRSVSYREIRGVLLDQASTDGDDTIYGFSAEDRIDGGAGNDILRGGNDNDTYVFGFGYGSDLIRDASDKVVSGQTDTVEFGSGVTVDDVTLARDAGSKNLKITLSDGSLLTIENQFHATFGVGTYWHDRIEVFSLKAADGSAVSWSHGDIMQMLLNQYSTDGNDALYGFDVAETLDAGLGDDFISGSNGNDTYIYDLGDGNDTISDAETHPLAGVHDTLQFGAGINAADISIARGAGNANDLILTIISTGHTITLNNQVWYNNINWRPDQIEEIRFGDGTIWSDADLRQAYLDRKNSAGNDVLDGFFSNDILDGGAGDDTLAGGDGDDTYRFGTGSGNDTIQETVQQFLITDADVVEFTTGLTLADVSFGAGPGANDLKVTLNASGETLTILGQNALWSGFTISDIEEFRFADGTVVTKAEAQNLNLAGQKTSGNDTIIGSDMAEVLDGGAGDDRLEGGGGNDVYRFGYGDGNDVISDLNVPTGGGDDAVEFGAGVTLADTRFGVSGNNLLITLISTSQTLLIENFFSGNSDRWVEELRFADGTILTREQAGIRAFAELASDGDDVIDGTDGGDIIEGGLGNDTLRGGEQSDTYVYTRGDGDDVIDETTAQDTRSGADDRVLLHGIDVASVSAERSGNDLVLVIAESAPGDGDGGRITLVSMASTPYQRGVEAVVFDDGTIWDRAELQRIYVTVGSTDGDDIINGTGADDILAGGLGNDTIAGHGGNDTYVYARGDGDDIFDETHSYIFNASNDRVVLHGIDPDDVTVERSGGDLILVIAESAPGVGDGGRITLVHTGQNEYNKGIEAVDFDDGTSWTRTDLRSRYFAGLSTAGDDTINGFNADDTFEAGLGNDMIIGMEGNDTYIYTRGDGDDVFNEATGYVFNGSNDRVLLHNIVPADVTVQRSGNDLILVVAESASGAGDGGRITLVHTGQGYYEFGIEAVVFDDGTSWSRDDLRAKYFAGISTSGDDTINGFNSSDTFDAGLGNDTITGFEGNDTYIYTRGDGDDVFNETTGYVLNGNNDRVVLHNIVPADVTIEKIGGDLILVITESAPGAGDAGRITLLHTAADYFEYGIEGVDFDDGTSWNRAQLNSMAIDPNAGVITGTDGVDNLSGTDGDDTFNGKLGDDHIDSRAGSDTFLYASGDGNDKIDEENNSSSTIDVLELTDLNRGDVSLEYIGNDLFVVDDTTGHRIEVDEQFYDNNSYWGIEQLKFADGTTLDRAAILAQAVRTGTDGAETMSGSDGDDIFNAKKGDDTINSAGGSDTFLYASGDGNDKIDEENNSSTAVDVLELTDLNAGDISLEHIGNDLFVVDTTTGHRIEIDEQYYASNSYWGIEQIKFADGTTWDRAKLKEEAIITGSAQADTLSGAATANRYQGLAGDDSIAGGAGNDTFIFASGFGNDTITDFTAGAASDDVIEFNAVTGATTYAEVLALAADDGTDTTITVDASNSIVLQNVVVADLATDDFRFV